MNISDLDLLIYNWLMVRVDVFVRYALKKEKTLTEQAVFYVLEFTRTSGKAQDYVSVQCSPGPHNFTMFSMW